MVQRKLTQQATSERDKMHRELTRVLEAVARGNTDDIRREHFADESSAPVQPDWLCTQSDDRGTGAYSMSGPASSARMDDSLETRSEPTREEQWVSGSDRSCSPSLLSDDGTAADSIGSASATSRYETHHKQNVEQVLEMSRQRAASTRRHKQHQEQEHQHQMDEYTNKSSFEDRRIDDEEVAFMAMAAAREVQTKQVKATKSKPAMTRSVDVRQKRTPASNTVRSREAADASAARRRNKRVRRKQKMARLSVMEAGTKN